MVLRDLKEPFSWEKNYIVGNTLVLTAVQSVTSLRAPSKLLCRCATITNSLAVRFLLTKYRLIERLQPFKQFQIEQIPCAILAWMTTYLMLRLTPVLPIKPAFSTRPRDQV